MNDPQIQMVLDAFQIADGCARADIECQCLPVSGTLPTEWWDTATADKDSAEAVALSIRYLEARGRLIRKPGEPHLVSFTEGA